MNMEKSLTHELLDDEFNLTEADENLNKYLTFISAELVYGIPIDNVVEIITNPGITSLPMVPSYVKGIMNLRGQIVPIIDIRQIMNKPVNEDVAITCVIILEIDSISIGVLVDTVLQVINVTNKLSDPPSKNLDFINGMTNLSDGTVMFSLDCQGLISNK
ncbi:chemotaxis protein CheW [Anaerotignum propionicum]|uniref:Chemotaxis protein CheW n=1 Tax=Anaerotignum propionicum DSM 1682 TaxID=991789 RepID=A0A0X8VEE7_ANAPI|nr:chemotaxis protein CheW [Anaerotignum propionicum]AMJ42401.1 chemotaxis protein CheW [Anaerotignum propionicum DSM 1682]MEA5058234.1 chemotaxis protein CheW [Anaerotignum propionicum]SHF01236.1 purine-binding chemotaxis protein CheW [[Clostridium] propionicum DSM 1682] [Anaerotignum propionicum DSM 1682]